MLERLHEEHSRHKHKKKLSKQGVPKDFFYDWISLGLMDCEPAWNIDPNLEWVPWGGQVHTADLT